MSFLVGHDEMDVHSDEEESQALSSSSSGIGEGVTHIYTISEILRIGLLTVHITKKRIKKSKNSRNVARFKAHFGVPPSVVAAVFEDLQRTNIPEARLPPDKRNIKHLLMAFHTLMRYPTNDEREAMFDMNQNDAAKVAWWYIDRIRALKAEKIVWPDDLGKDDEKWIISVDGTHFWIQEPSHPEWSMDTTFYSHKFNKAGLNYELGILLFGGLIWMNGSFPAATGDITIFVSKGLQDRLEIVKKKAIGDAGYNGHHKYVSTPNSIDTRNVKKFKSRALKRHEKFNGRIKTFDCLTGRFRHNRSKFEACVESVCVILQYDIELGNPLFEILIDDLMGDEEFNEPTIENYGVPAVEGGMRQETRQNPHQEPPKESTIPWGKSKARDLLFKDVQDGIVPLSAKDERGKPTMALRAIYDMRPEYGLYDYAKFSGRLSSIRKSIKDRNNRARDDIEAFEIYKRNHNVSHFSHKGYIQWMGSEARELVLEAIEGRKIVEARGAAFQEFYESQAAFFENFDLEVFRDKVRQEIRTMKYYHTLQVKGKHFKSS
jgi:hypothetical protein